MSIPAKLILITGPPGIGKTTLVTKVCSELMRQNELKIAGFTTEEIRINGVRSGFQVVTVDNKMEAKRATLATANPGGKQGPSVGKYTVLVEEFEHLAMQCLEECKSADILVLDELGKMESFSKRFVSEVKRILEDPKRPLILATIPICKGKPLDLVQSVMNKATESPITLTRLNRDSQCQMIVDMISESLQ